MRRIILLAVAIFVANMSMAQNIDAMVSRLDGLSMSGNRVRVTEDVDTRSAVDIVEAQRRSKVVSGFRIVIYSDNGQYAGDNAEKELRSFRSMFPYINAYLVYESPYFKVSVGDCLSMEEAQMLMAQLTPHYPKAFPKRENIRFEELYGARREVRDTLVNTTTVPIVEGN
jgi:hypothetical protein